MPLIVAVALGSLIVIALLVRLGWEVYLHKLRSKPQVMISYRYATAPLTH